VTGGRRVTLAVGRGQQHRDQGPSNESGQDSNGGGLITDGGTQWIAD
jgi:hypothetical protein